MNNSFPVILVNVEDEVNTEVGIPHKGYSIQTVMENGKMKNLEFCMRK